MAEEDYIPISLEPELEELDSIRKKFLGKYISIKYTKNEILKEGRLETVNDKNIVLKTDYSILPMPYKFNIRIKEIPPPQKEAEKKEGPLEEVVKR